MYGHVAGSIGNGWILPSGAVQSSLLPRVAAVLKLARTSPKKWFPKLVQKNQMLRFPSIYLYCIVFSCVFYGIFGLKDNFGWHHLFGWQLVAGRHLLSAAISAGNMIGNIIQEHQFKVFFVTKMTTLLLCLLLVIFSEKKFPEIRCQYFSDSACWQMSDTFKGHFKTR